MSSQHQVVEALVGWSFPLETMIVRIMSPAFGASSQLTSPPVMATSSQGLGAIGNPEVAQELFVKFLFPEDKRGTLEVSKEQWATDACESFLQVNSLSQQSFELTYQFLG